VSGKGDGIVAAV